MKSGSQAPTPVQPSSGIQTVGALEKLLLSFSMDIKRKHQCTMAIKFQMLHCYEAK